MPSRSEAPGDKDLWTEKTYSDFVIRMDWRIKEAHGAYPMPEILPDGSHKLGADGKEILTPRPNADSGLYLSSLRAETVSLEDLFLSITAREEVAA